VCSPGCVKNRLCAAEFVGDQIVCIRCQQSSPAVYVYSADTQHYQATIDTTVNPRQVLKCYTSVTCFHASIPADDKV